MKPRDILFEIFANKLTIEQAYELYDNIMDSPFAAEVAALLMLTKFEWNAYCHGATFDDLSRWRYEGWPKKCVKCGRDIEVSRFGWRVIDDLDGVSTLKHVQCPSEQSAIELESMTPGAKTDHPQGEDVGGIRANNEYRTSGIGSSQRYYDWNYTHNDIDVYDCNGNHFGSMNPTTGEMYKPFVPGRKIPKP